MPTSRSSGRLSDEAKWDADARMGVKDDVKQQMAASRTGPSSATKQRVTEKLQKAKRDINEAAAELEADLQQDDEAPLEGEEEEEEQDQDESVEVGSSSRTSLRSRGANVQKQVEDKARDLKSKGREVASSLKQQGRDLLAQGKAALRQSRGRAEQGQEEEEGEEGESSDWQASLKSKGTSLLHSGLEQAGALRSKIEAAAPGVKDSLGRVASKAKKLMAQADFRDGEQEAESASEDDEGEAEQASSAVSRQASNLRGRASEAADSARKAVRKGKAALDSATEEATTAGRFTVRQGKDSLNDAADSALDAGRKVARKGKAALDSASEDVPDTLNSWRAQGSKKLDQARAQGEKLVGKARETIANFDFDAAREEASNRAASVGTTLRNKTASLRQQAEETYDESVPSDTKARINDAASKAGSKLRGAKAAARDALSDAEEDLGMTDAAFNDAAKSGLRKFDRVVAEDGNMKLPLMVIGAIAALWLGASLYQLVNGPVEVAPPPPANVLDAARQAAHDWKLAGMEQLHNLETRTQGFVDTITGHKRPLTWSEKLGNTLSGFKDTLFGAPRPGYDVAHARDAIRNARDRAEERSAGLQRSLEDTVIPTIKDGYHNLADGLGEARRYAEDKLIPGAKDGYARTAELAHQTADEARYHAAHTDEYIRKAREAGSNVANLARTGAEDLNLIPKQSLGSRVWSWMTGRETVVEQAQRLAHEAQIKANDMRARAPGAVDDIRSRVNDGIDSIADHMPHAHRTTRERIVDGIKAHLPGHQATVGERMQNGANDAIQQASDLKDRFFRNIPNLDKSGSAEEYVQRAKAAGYSFRDGAWALLPHQRTVGERLVDGIKSHLPGAHPSATQQVQDGIQSVKDQASQLSDRISRNIPNLDTAGSIQEYAARAKAAGYELRDGAWSVVNNVLPHERSLGERFIDSIKAHLPGAHPSVQQRLQNGVEAFQRNIPNIDASGSVRDYADRAKAAGYELRDGAWALLPAAHRTVGERVTDSIKAHLPGAHPSATYQVENGLQSLRDQASSLGNRLQRNLPNIDVSGTAQEYADRAWAAGYELRDGVWDFLPHHRSWSERMVDGVKSHLPGAHPSTTQQVEDGLQSLRDQAVALGNRLQRNLPNVDPRGSAQEYADRAWAAGYQLRDGAWDLVDRARNEAHIAASHVHPHRRSVSELAADSIKAHLPGAHPSATQQVQDGLQSLRDQASAMGERLQRNLPNIDASGTAQEYADRAWAAGYELRDGAWNLVNRAHATAQQTVDNVQRRAHATAQQAVDNVQRNIPNVDTRGTIADYTERARQAGYELRNGAWSLIHSAQQAGHEAAHNLQHVGQQQQHVQPPVAQAPVVQTPVVQAPVSGQAVPVVEVLSEIQNAQPEPSSSINVVDAKKVPAPVVHRESLGDKIKHGIESIRTHLPGGQPHVEVQHAQAVPTPVINNAAAQANIAVNQAQASAQAAAHNLHARAQDAAAHVRSGVNGVVDEVKGALPTDATLHHLKKEAEYVQRRTVHKAEELGHRVEEKLKEAADHVQYHIPN